MNRRGARSSQRSDPEYNPESSDYYDGTTLLRQKSTIREEHQIAMENLRAEMMAEIKELKTRQGGGRLEQVMKEANTTPLTPYLARASIPQKCLVPAFDCYDGSADPAAHLRYYNQMMSRWDNEDSILCRYFPSSLKRSALSWFDNLPSNSIDSYDQLTEKFIATYMYNKVVNTGM